MGNCACINNYNSHQKSINLDVLNNNCPRIITENGHFKDIKSRNNIIGNDSLNVKSTDNISCENTFEIKMLKEINFVRTNPKKYALKLKELIQNIICEDDNEYLIPYKNDFNKDKILLKNGKKVIFETINFLNNIKPMKQLKYSDDIKIQFKDCNEINNFDGKFKFTSEIIGKLILNKRLELLKKYEKCYFNIDIFEDPILSIVFQLTDEAFNKDRRNAILNPYFTLFSVNYFRDENNKFLSILSFA